MRTLTDLQLGWVLGAITALAVTTFLLSVFGETTFMEAVQVGGLIAIAASAYFAYGLLLTTTQRNHADVGRARSNSVLREAILAMERAYEMFALGSDANKGVPVADRLRWLSVARMLLRYEKLNALVSEEDHKVALAEHEEFWRLRFYELLDTARHSMTKAYFLNGGSSIHHANALDQCSVLVIYDFARWEKGKPDPLDGVEPAELVRRGVIPIDHIGVREFLDGLGFNTD